MKIISETKGLKHELMKEIQVLKEYAHNEIRVCGGKKVRKFGNNKFIKSNKSQNEKY